MEVPASSMDQQHPAQLFILLQLKQLVLLLFQLLEGTLDALALRHYYQLAGVGRSTAGRTLPFVVVMGGGR